MKKQIVLNLDAALMIVVLFVATLGLNALQYSFNAELTGENQRLQWQGLEDKLNLDSLRGALERRQSEMEDCRVPEASE